MRWPSLQALRKSGHISPSTTIAAAAGAAFPNASRPPVAKATEQTPHHKQETADCPKHFCIYALRFGCPLCVQDAFHNTFGTQFEGAYVHSQMEETERQEDASCPS